MRYAAALPLPRRSSADARGRDFRAGTPRAFLIAGDRPGSQRQAPASSRGPGRGGGYPDRRQLVPKAVDRLLVAQPLGLRIRWSSVLELLDTRLARSHLAADLLQLAHAAREAASPRRRRRSGHARASVPTTGAAGAAVVSASLVGDTADTDAASSKEASVEGLTTPISRVPEKCSRTAAKRSGVTSAMTMRTKPSSQRTGAAPMRASSLLPTRSADSLSITSGASSR